MSLRRRTATGSEILAGSSSVTLYGTTGQNTDGAMTQKAVTDALEALSTTGLSVSYDSETETISFTEVSGSGDDISYDPLTETIIVS